jgi:type I restriction-modification system DNA methylase subunit
MTHDKNAFISAFNSIAKHKHRYKVFEDFVTVSAITLHNSVNMLDSLEQEYLTIIKGYSKKERFAIAELFAMLVDLLNPEPIDILGQLYMELEISSKGNGQFFTPDAVSQLMGSMVYGGKIELPPCGFITMSEPACGAGGMVLAYVKEMLNQKLNPVHHLWVQCVDIDRMVALMCYIQLSLWAVPAQIIVGNTLTLEYREQFFTPAHYNFNWDYKLRKRRESLAEEKEIITPKEKNAEIKTEPEKSKLPSQPKTEIVEVDEIVQLDLFDNL